MDEVKDPSQRDKLFEGGIPHSRKSPGAFGNWLFLFPIITTILATKFTWPFRWILSGTAALTFCLILGDYQGSRILSFIPLWTQVALLNLLYAVCATSWLFYWTFSLTCYPAIVLSCLFQFDLVASFVRRILGLVMKELHFINDKIAFFDIPALEIDTEVDGLLVIRGITISLSRLSIVAHGVEVGIKLTEDMELAIQVDEVRVLFFRKIEIGDVYANLKGGEYEMTFGHLPKRATGDSLMVSDTPLLQAAALRGDTARPDLFRTASKLTNGAEPQQVSVKAGLGAMTHISPDESGQKYRNSLAHIQKTSAIQEKLRAVRAAATNGSEDAELLENHKDMRAAVCSMLHGDPSVPHPPLRSIKVTTLRNLSSPYMRRFMHRLPLLLRLLLNPLSYFHPVEIESLTVAGSGEWLKYTLHEFVFKSYGESDAGIRKLEKRVSDWLSDANFVLQLVNVTGHGQVPISTTYDIISRLKIDDVLAYRTQTKVIDLKQVVRLGGADATADIPSFLLPHHEHLLPPLPTVEKIQNQEQEIMHADGIAKEVQARSALKHIVKDETNIKLSVHARLPAVFDQELLDFIAALVKAIKIIEKEMEPEPGETDSAEETETLEPATKRTMKELAASLRTNMKEGMKTVNESMRRVGIDAVANDRFIAKLVGKITKKLEMAQGEIGYSGIVPVALAPYRAIAEKEMKLLP